MKAWHFVGEKLRNGSPVPADGEWLEHSGPVKIRESGLHASKHPFDVLKFAAGNTLCLVEVEGVKEEQSDLLVCRRRKIVKRMDFEKQMRNFARQQALKVIHLWKCPAIVRQYLETGDESIRIDALNAIHNSVAWSATDSACYTTDATWSARDATWFARDTAWFATDPRWSAAEAAWGAANSASCCAREAARSTKQREQRTARKEFKQLVNEENEKLKA